MREDESPLTIRPAQPSDLEAIVRLHVAVWRETYRDLVAPEIAACLDEAERRPRWIAMLASPGTLVAEIDGALVGFAQVALGDDTIFGGRPELKYLYVDRTHARRGIGRRLLAAAATEILAQGQSRLGVGVVVGNDPAIAFYEALGAHRAGRYRDPGPLWPSDNYVYAWDDIASLAA